MEDLTPDFSVTLESEEEQELSSSCERGEDENRSYAQLGQRVKVPSTFVVHRCTSIRSKPLQSYPRKKRTKSISMIFLTSCTESVMVRLTGVPLDAKPLSQRLAGTVGVRLGDQDFARRERVRELFVDGGEVPARIARNERKIGCEHLKLIANRFEPSEFMGLLAMPTLPYEKQRIPTTVSVPHPGNVYNLQNRS
jgi:hypothetical protein